MMSINYISLDKAYNNQSLNNFFDPQHNLNNDNGMSYEDAIQKMNDLKAKKVIDINHLSSEKLCSIHMSHIQTCDICSNKLKALIQLKMSHKSSSTAKKNKINSIIILIIILMLFIGIYSWEKKPYYKKSNVSPQGFEIFYE